MSDKTRIELDGFDEGRRRDAVRLDEVDSEIRAKCVGQSVQDIAVQAEGAFETIGVQLTGEQLADYAEAVSQGRPFDLRLT